jgi:integrase
MSRGRDGLYRRENAIFAFRYKDLEGKWREKYAGTIDRQAARKFREEFLYQLKRGELPTEMGEWPLDVAKTWWLEFRRPRVAPATLGSERYRMNHFIKILGNRRLREIDNVQLDRYVTARLEEGIGSWSINKEVLLWSLILKKAKLWSRLRDDYKPLRTRASDIGRAITREELHRLAHVAQSNVDWEAALYGSILAANAGLRGGEIKSLRLGAIDSKRRCLTIRRRDAKTDASARHIELNRDAMNAAEHLLMRARILGAANPDHYLMPKNLSRIVRGPNKGKRGYDPTQHQECWDTAWTSLTKKAGLQGFRFHDVRHTFISHMVERGVPLGVIQTFVGHISARMVRHYTHITSGAARRAVELFDNDPILTEPADSDPLSTVSSLRIN